MDTGTYDIGYALGRHWAQRDASPEQLLSVQNIGDGKTWVAKSADPISEFLLLVGPDKSVFLSTSDGPSNSFVAGFIDGTGTVKL